MAEVEFIFFDRGEVMVMYHSIASTLNDVIELIPEIESIV